MHTQINEVKNLRAKHLKVKKGQSIMNLQKSKIVKVKIKHL